MIYQASILIDTLRQRGIIELCIKGYRLWRREGRHGLANWLKSLNRYSNYQSWIKKFDTITEEDEKAIADKIRNFDITPTISVLMPTYNTPEKWLRRSIESVISQFYPHWELCIADDASTETHVRLILQEYASLDERIHVTFRPTNGHISNASNTCLEMASGEFLALLDHDDELRPHALYMVTQAINENEKLDLIYSDEDKITETGIRYSHYFKTEWDPDLFTAQNMISHLGVYRTSIAREVGGFQTGYEGAQDWDLALRISEKIASSNIKHIPHILYHWRTTEGSTAISVSEKPYAKVAAQRAVQDHLDRLNTGAHAELILEGYFRIHYPVPTLEPLVSIIIPTHNALELLRPCIESITMKTTYKNYEVIVVDNNSKDSDLLHYLAELDKNNVVRVISYPNPFNYSAINNFAVQFAQGEILCLLNNDIEVISPNWLSELVSHAIRKSVGAVGAMLYYPDDTIQHAGVLIGQNGVAGHRYLNFRKGEQGYLSKARLAQSVSAVTAACLVVRKELYLEVDGLDEINLSVAFNDIDFCLRLLERGFRNIWTPYAELYHYESASRGPDDSTPEKLERFKREIDYMHSRWPEMIAYDPAYNPNLTLEESWPYLAKRPRNLKPWLKQDDQRTHLASS